MSLASARRFASAPLPMVVCAMLSACGEPGPAAHLTMADIKSIVTPLAYREDWGRKCGDAGIKVATDFMADLKAAGATADLQTQAQAEIDRVTALEKDTPAEYVCTADLAESTELNATAAQMLWRDMKRPKP